MTDKKRLIDANSLLEKVQFRLEIDNATAEIIAGCVNITRQLIENEPAVDAVEVVRCRDCVYYETGKDYLPYCNHADGGIEDYPREEDFCSYGERKDDGKNSID